jgi:hypothetical protein
VSDLPKVSLWLEVPALQPVVDALAAEVGNPSFRVHLTVTGTADPDTDLTRVGPERLSLTSFGTRHDEKRFFCLLAEPSAGLPEWPHVSLVYGTDRACREWPDPMQLSGRFGDRLFGDYDVAAVSLWTTGGPVESWRCFRRHPLG